MRRSYIIQWVLPNGKLRKPTHTLPMQKTTREDYIFSVLMITLVLYFGYGLLK
jgi:hypothetical protein